MSAVVRESVVHAHLYSRILTGMRPECCGLDLHLHVYTLTCTCVKYADADVTIDTLYIGIDINIDIDIDIDIHTHVYTQTATHTHTHAHTHTPDYSVEGALGRSNAQALHYAAGRPALSPGSAPAGCYR